MASMPERESETIEYKRSTAELKQAVISLVAMLNKHGAGTVYFGVANDGKIIGQDVSADTLRTISQAIGNHIRPTVYPTVTTHTRGGREIIEVTCEGSQRPYLAYNIPRIRVADEDLVMEQPTYEDMLRKRATHTHAWEAQAATYTIDDVDTDLFNTYLARAREAGRIEVPDTTPQAVLTQLGLTHGTQLTNAAAALFVNTDINELQMARFPTDERLTFTDMKRLSGPILSLAPAAVNYLINAIDWRVEFHGDLARHEVPEIPIDALREAVINAFAHRNIESGEAVDIAVHRSFVEISSPGAFPTGLTPDMFIHGGHRPVRRNPLITRALYYSKDMESFATGLKRIQVACDEAGVRVEYFLDQYGFTVRFYRRAASLPSAASSAFAEDSLSPVERDLITVLKNGAQPISALSATTGYTVNQVRHALTAMRARGQARMIGGRGAGGATYELTHHPLRSTH